MEKIKPMSKVKKAMQKQGLVYFSSLTSSQKNESINYIRIIKNGLLNLPYELAIEILKNRDLDEVLKETEFINNKIQGQKMFKHNKKYLPLNINQILNFTQ